MTPLVFDWGWLALTGVIGYLLGKGFSKKTKFILAVIISYVSLHMIKMMYKTGLPALGYKDAILSGIVGGLIIFAVAWIVVFLMKAVMFYYRRKDNDASRYLNTDKRTASSNYNQDKLKKYLSVTLFIIIGLIYLLVLIQPFF